MTSPEAHSLDIFAPDLFRDRCVLVTGGGTGIGRATALAFANLGARVAVAGRTEEKLEETADLIRKKGGECLVHPTNIRDLDSVDSLHARVKDVFGRLDCLVNNAGGQFPSLPSQISDGGWRAVIDLNLNGTWNMISRFSPDMVEQESGSIVNVVHVFSFDRGAPLFAHSGAARAGVVNLTRSMAYYLAPHGVTMNALAPGTVDTAGLLEHEIAATEEMTGVADFLAKAVELSPSSRVGTSEEVAAAILFLCSPAGRWINGSAMVMDGGESVGNWFSPIAKGSF